MTYDLWAHCSLRAICGAFQVQQEYDVLFDSNTGDPEAVARWRNRALRFVLPSDGDLPDGTNHPTLSMPVQGVGLPKLQSCVIWLQTASACF